MLIFTDFLFLPFLLLLLLLLLLSLLSLAFLFHILPPASLLLLCSLPQAIFCHFIYLPSNLFLHFLLPSFPLLLYSFLLPSSVIPSFSFFSSSLSFFSSFPFSGITLWDCLPPTSLSPFPSSPVFSFPELPFSQPLPPASLPLFSLLSCLSFLLLPAFLPLLTSCSVYLPLPYPHLLACSSLFFYPMFSSSSVAFFLINLSQKFFLSYALYSVLMSSSSSCLSTIHFLWSISSIHAYFVLSWLLRI